MCVNSSLRYYYAALLNGLAEFDAMISEAEAAGVGRALKCAVGAKSGYASNSAEEIIPALIDHNRCVNLRRTGCVSAPFIFMDWHCTHLGSSGLWRLRLVPFGERDQCMSWWR